MNFNKLFCRFSALIVVLLLTACSIPQVKAEDRIFLPIALDFLGEYQLPKTTFENTPVGGLSGIVYDRQRDRFYAISDDRSDRAPARFYTLKLTLKPTPEIEKVEVEKVTVLKAEDGQPYSAGTIDLEGIAISPRRSLFISSEGVARNGIAPFIDEFNLETGQWQSRLPIPKRYLPAVVEGQPVGVQDNLGVEALTLNASGSVDGQLEPFRLFAAAESALSQDLPEAEAKPTPVRLMHYLVGSDRPTLLSEHLYSLDPPADRTSRGLSELLTVDQGGHFLSLERSFGLLTGFGAQLFQIAMGGATDISGVGTLKGDISGITAIYKRSLLDLADLKIPLDNLEGMTLGPRLPDGTKSLLLVSDDNFNEAQITQFLLFRIRGLS